MIENEQTWITYEADGNQRQWEFPYKYVNASDVSVYVEHSGVLRKISPSLYEFDEVTRKITYPKNSASDPVPYGDVVLLWRETPVKQLEDSTLANFKSNDVERMVDKLTIICQELSDKLTRTVTYDPTNTQGEVVDANLYIKMIKQYMVEAEEYSQQASRSASSASNSALTAVGKASDAADSATNASNSATAANNSKNAAGDYATDAAGSALTAAQEAQRAIDASHSYIPKVIGEVYYSQSNDRGDNPAAMPGWTGELVYYTSTTFQGLKTFLTNHPELCTTQADYDSRIAQYGECPLYVLNTANTSIRLPKLCNYIKMANSTNGITQKEAGLPNITGGIYYVSEDFREQGSCDGAFTKQDGYRGSHTPHSTDSQNVAAIQFNASKSNATYGKSDTNTPAHTTLYPWIVVSTTLDSLVNLNGNVIAVKEYTEAQWEALDPKPMNELSLVGYQEEES